MTLGKTKILALYIFVTLIFVSQTVAQTLQPVTSTIRQEVFVEYKDMVYCFVRRAYQNNEFGEWVNQYPPPEYGTNKKSHSIKTKKVDQKIVKQYMGEAMWNHFEKWNIAVVSGIFNYSSDKRFDYKTFGGQKYGTWMKENKLEPLPRKRSIPFVPQGGS